MSHLKDKSHIQTKNHSKMTTQPKAASQGKIDKHALAKRFLQLGKPEQVKFIELLSNKGLDFEKLPIVSVGSEQQVELSRHNSACGISIAWTRVTALIICPVRSM